MQVNISKLAKLTGFHRETVTKRVAGLEPARVHPSQGKFYRSDEALQAIYLQSDADIDKAQLDLQQERARLARSQREMQDLKIAKEKKELVPADQIATAWGRIATSIRNQFLALPNRLAQMLETTSDTKERRTMIDREVRTILEALADKGQEQ